ncbi:MAG: DNA repair protein RecO, partial [Chloroflexi bacterium]|nr:DNA repair protein RecO [Chloroflexota bacterium]
MPDFHSFRVSAVVVRHSDWGEADRLLTLYTREQGMMRALAKGARKITSRKAGHLQPFTHVTLQLAKGRDLPIVTQAETVNAFLPLHDDLVKTGYAAYVIELLYRFSYEEEGGNPVIFRLLVETLDRIEKEADAWLPIRYYEMRLLDAVGFRPRLFECANCGREILPEDQFFSFTAGGVICPRCGAGLPNPAKISLETLKYFRH